MRFWERLADHGDCPALITENLSLSYAELATRADAFCAALRARLPAAVTRPLIVLETANEPDPVTAYIGALRAGWPVILVAEGAGGGESQIAQTYGPNVVFRRVGSGGRPGRGSGWQADMAAPDPIPMHPDLAVLLSTSGTTGAAKLVRLSGQNLAANAQAIVSYLDVRPTDRAITVLPFHYSYGLSVLHIHLACGAAVVLTEGSVKDAALQALARRTGVTSLALVPTQFEMLEDISWLPDLRYITQAGGRIDPVLARRFAAQAAAEGWQLFIMYGQTEAAPRMSYVPPQDARDWCHTIGRPIPGGTFRLQDAAGATIAATRVTGELVYEGPNVMLGYATCRADLAAPAGPAILHTGDMAERLENGYIRITGRASRFIKLFGLRIGLDEVETQLRTEGLRAYASGTDARLVVFVQDEPDRPALQARLATRYQLPHSAVHIAPLETVPLLASGKVDYRALAHRVEQIPFLPAANPDTQALLRQVLRLQEIDPDRSFLDLGGDSLAYLEVQLHFVSLSGAVPANWEHKPLRELITLAPPPQPTGSVLGGGLAPALQTIPADLLARVIAVLAVIALHSTAWPTGGGAYLLLVLAGYSLARFQSGVLSEGGILRTWRSMLVPIVVCYMLLISLIALFWAPVGAAWFMLMGNFLDDIPLKGLIPYWFVSTYVQSIILVTLPFVVPALRRQIVRRPFVAGLVLLAGLVLAIAIFHVSDIPPARRHRHPLAAVELLVLGWCVCFARSSMQKTVITAVTLGVWWITWPDVTLSTTLLLLLGTGAVIWGLTVRLPLWVARGLMRVGAMTLFLYLVHVPIIALVSRMIPGPDILHFPVVLGASLVAALAIKRWYEAMASILATGWAEIGRRARPNRSV